MKIQRAFGFPNKKNRGSLGDMTLIPFYKIHHERYSVYWNVMGEAR